MHMFVCVVYLYCADVLGVVSAHIPHHHMHMHMCMCMCMCMHMHMCMCMCMYVHICMHWHCAYV